MRARIGKVEKLGAIVTAIGFITDGLGIILGENGVIVLFIGLHLTLLGLACWSWFALFAWYDKWASSRGRSKALPAPVDPCSATDTP